MEPDNQRSIRLQLVMTSRFVMMMIMMIVVVVVVSVTHGQCDARPTVTFPA